MIYRTPGNPGIGIPLILIGAICAVVGIEIIYIITPFGAFLMVGGFFVMIFGIGIATPGR